MAKKPNNRNVPPARPALPAQKTPDPVPLKPVVVQVTSGQIEELELLAMEVEQATGAPPPSLEPAPDASLPTLLSRATGILAEIEAMRARARQAEADAKERVSRLDEQKRAQEASHGQALKALEGKARELADDRRKHEEDKKKGLVDLDGRRVAFDNREQKLLDDAVALAERETNAEVGFLEQRRKIVGELGAQLEQLREQRDAMLTELENSRSAEDLAVQNRGEERAARHRSEDEARATASDELRRKLTDELSGIREARLAEVGRELAEARRAAETERQKEDRRSLERATVERADLDGDRKALEGLRRQIRSERNLLTAEQELLHDDREGFDLKVVLFGAARVAELEGDLVAIGEQRDAAVRQRDAYFLKLEAHVEMERRLGGRRAEDVLAQLGALEKKNADLHSELGKRLSGESERRLEELEGERSRWQEDLAVLRHKLAETEHRIGRLREGAIELEGLRGQKEALETSKKLLDAALKELRAEVDKYTQADEKRNPMEALVALDADEKLNVEPHTAAPIGKFTKTLAEFAEDLRHRIATGVDGRTLYYSERDVRCFLGGIAMSRLLLLQGISGTGKTSLPLAFAGAIGAGVEVVEVQAGWRDRQDLIGYFNAFHRHYYATNFLQALYRAGTPKFADRPVLIILDEINLSRVEQFFADFLSALEQPVAKRRLTLMNDPLHLPPRLMIEGRHLPIPPNVWFIGTANHDETTTEFADKTYDRAHVMELPRRDPKRDVFAVTERRARDPISYTDLEAAFDKAVGDRADDIQRVQAWLRADNGIADILDRRFRIGWGNRLEEQAKRFVAVVVEAGGSVGEAVDHLLQTRVLRKLRDRHDVRPKALEEFRAAFEKSWDALDKEHRPTRSLQLIDREIRAKKDEEPA